MLDLIIRGATLVDGTGAPAITADLGVVDGRVAAIGRLAEPARQTVAADGLVLAPGIVDIHTHYDAQLTWDPTASPSTGLGVTTVVMGNCGFSIAPCPPERRDLVARNLSEVEGMSLTSLRTGIDWRFERFGEYLDLVQSKGPHLNVAGFVGHSTVRSAVMGEAASERKATEDEIARMCPGRGSAAGAVGFASQSGTTPAMAACRCCQPRRRGRNPTAGVLGEAGRGVYQMTAGPNTSVAFLESLGRETGRPIIFSSVFQNDTFPDRGPGQLRDCAAARTRGVEVYGQTSCQPLTMEFTLANAYPLSSLDVWDDLRGADAATLTRHFAEPTSAAASAPRWHAQEGQALHGNWARVRSAGRDRRQRRRDATPTSRRPATAIRSTSFELALRRPRHPVLGPAHQRRRGPAGADAAARQRVALSDAGAHLSFSAMRYGLHLLGHWVRDRKAFTLEEAVRQLTSKPADIYRILTAVASRSAARRRCCSIPPGGAQHAARRCPTCLVATAAWRDDRHARGLGQRRP
jgi:N-acyl-D-aspartate/D-glutamate deacylase